MINYYKIKLVVNVIKGVEMTKKLVLIIDAKFAKLYNAEGLKIRSLISKYTPDEFDIVHKKQSLRTGFKKQTSGAAHFFDPHTEAKDIERSEFSKKISEIIKNKVNGSNFSELIIIAAPKMLNLMRKHLFKFIKIEVKEVAKDLIHATESQIAKVAFS